MLAASPARAPITASRTGEAGMTSCWLDVGLRRPTISYSRIRSPVADHTYNGAEADNPWKATATHDPAPHVTAIGRWQSLPLRGRSIRSTSGRFPPSCAMGRWRC